MSVSAQSGHPSLTHYLEPRVPERVKGWLFIALLAGLGTALLIGMARTVTQDDLAEAQEMPLLLD